MNKDYDPIHPGEPDVPSIPDDYTTPNYHLLLWKKSTITSWLTQLNKNMLKIDVIMHNLALRTSIDGDVPPEAIENIITINEEIAKINNTIEPLVEQVNLMQQSVNNLQTQMTTVLADVGTLKINYVNLDTRMSTVESTQQNITSTVEKIENNYNDLNTRVMALENNP